MRKSINMKCSLFVVAFLFLASCQKYLDAKPDKALVIPSTVEDLQALLNLYANNQGFDPGYGEVASDNYYVLDNNLNTQSEILRSCYLWNGSLNVENSSEWSILYKRIFIANVVLDNVDKVSANFEPTRDFVKGQALFFRAWSLFKLMQIYALPYNPNSATTDLGIPIKLVSDINAPTTRPSLKMDMEQIINDYTMAASLLPENADVLARPCKAAAYAAIAEAQLVAGNYSDALAAAKSSLSSKDVLTDYNTLDASVAKPLAFPSEVLLDSRVKNNAILNRSVAKVNPILYELYFANDKRKTVFYGMNADNSYYFKGGYDGNLGASTPFSGLAVDEVYFIASEAEARLDNTGDALEYLNKLSKNRYDNTFVPFTATTSVEALHIILTERRKELAFRGGIRWMDLKRLNLDPQFATTLTRTYAGATYTLVPNDPRYAFLIPASVIQLSGIEQNKR